MGKSTACLRIIACGGGSFIQANEAAFVDQTKCSKEKRGWSFKKKSSTCRAVAKSPIEKTPSFEHKENIDSAPRDFFVSEKDSGPQWDEKSQVPPYVALDLHIPDGAIVYENEKQPPSSASNLHGADNVSSLQTDEKPATAAAKSHVADEVSSPNSEKHSDAANLCVNDDMTVSKTGEYEPTLAVHESDVIIIQAAVRGFLDRKELESLIKLQAMVRGHLVRCHAVGALRCVQAIAKMQVLVRARYAHTRKEDRVTSKSKPEITYTSMTGLLKSSFARRLLESSPKSKPIKIICDPLRRDSSWVWLDRWMSLASSGAVDGLNARNEMVQEEPDVLDEVEIVEWASEESSVNHTVSEYSPPEFDSMDKKSESKTKEALEHETEVTEGANDACKELKTGVDAKEAVQLQTQIKNNVSGSQQETDNSLATESELVSAPLSAKLSDSVLQNARAEEPISDDHVAAVYHDSIPLKVEKIKESPASVTNSVTDYIHESQNEETEKAVLPHSSEFDLIEENAASSEDDIVINLQVAYSNIQVDESESNYSAELSITSTLDSLDRWEIEPVNVELENLAPVSKLDTVDDELETEFGSVEKGNSEFVNGESAVYGTHEDMVFNEKELETNVSIVEFQLEEGDEKDTKTNKSDLRPEPESASDISHQASPGSQVTFSESQVTPSSQVSVSKKSKIVKKSGSIKKRTILSSSEKNSSERQPKEQNSANRRTSFGSPSSKPEVPDKELRRDRSLSSSLPSYMQATKSARAKTNATSHSPRSSPDVPDNDVLMKRHSLSSAKDKQGSPRLSRNSSQTHSSSKSNGTSPFERKWQK